MVGRAADGVVEAIEAEGRDAPLVAGVQWHPADLDPAHRRALFGALVEAAGRRSRSPGARGVAGSTTGG